MGNGGYQGRFWPLDSDFPVIDLNPVHEYAFSAPAEPDEQERIASCLSSLDAVIAAETQKLEAFKRHKRGLMQQLFPSQEEAEA